MHVGMGDQPVDAGFSALQVWAPLAAAVPLTVQLYPHIGTAVPSGNVAVVGAAVRLTTC